MVTAQGMLVCQKYGSAGSAHFIAKVLIERSGVQPRLKRGKSRYPIADQLVIIDKIRFASFRQ
jgi:hypothetical protein